jgi:protein gp37
MGDLFHESVPDDYLDRVFAVMVLAPQHTYQILTKRADRLAHYMRLPRCGAWPLPNVWCGVSVEDQRHADERIHLLLQTPAAVRFISAEPLLGPVDFRPHLYCPQCGYSKKDVAELMDHRLCKGPGPAIDQIVVGGESGPGARPCDVEWIRAIVRQCREANVACFVKQLGFSPVGIADGIAYRGNTTQMPDGFYRFLNDRKGSDPSEWPEDLRVREFPLRIA